MDLVSPAIAECLKGSYPDDSAFAASTGRVAAAAEVVAAVGDAVYWGRRVEPQGVSAVTVGELSMSPQYKLGYELATIQALVTVSIYTQGKLPIVCYRIADACRRALSGYRGTLWGPDETETMIKAAVILRETMATPRVPPDMGPYWAFGAEFDLEVTYDRTVVAD